MMTERLNVPITLRVDDRAPSTETPEIIEDTNARRESFILPWQIKEMRERLSYSRREMGELFQVGEENWSQWENGADRPDSALSLLMRALYDGDVSTSYVSAKRPRLSMTAQRSGASF
jgi:DNA-binding transcriptional regulator YiaG